MTGALLWLSRLFVEPEAQTSVARPRIPDRSEVGFVDVEVVVVGLSPGCGASTVAAGLSLAFVDRGYENVSLVAVGRTTALADRVGSVQVCRVPAALSNPDEIAQYGAMVARVQGGRGVGDSACATVWDMPAAESAAGGEAMRDVGQIVAVAAGDADPALTAMAVDMLAERCTRVSLVANRAGAGSQWEARARACVPDSRVAVRLLARGRLGGGLAAPLAALAADLEAGG